MAGAESGGGAGINFGALRERSRQELCECIDMLSGPKALVLDPSLSGPLGLVAEKQLLKAHGVEKTYHLKSEPLDTDQRRVVFIVRDSIVNVKAIAAQVRATRAFPTRRSSQTRCWRTRVLTRRDVPWRR